MYAARCALPVNDSTSGRSRVGNGRGLSSGREATAARQRASALCPGPGGVRDAADAVRVSGARAYTPGATARWTAGTEPVDGAADAARISTDADATGAAGPGDTVTAPDTSNPPDGAATGAPPRTGSSPTFPTLTSGALPGRAATVPPTGAGTGVRGAIGPVSGTGRDTIGRS